MDITAGSSHRLRPENLIARLVARLSHHALWDALLLFGPPALASIYIVWRLFETAWLSTRTAGLASAAFAVLGAIAVYLCRRPLIPGTRAAARLIDRQSGAKDHFLTLATLDPAAQPQMLLARLRGQAAGFLERVDLKRDFPFRPKRSAYWSFVGSLLTAGMVHFFLLPGWLGHDSPGTAERLRALAQQMAADEELRALARELEALAARLKDPELSAEQKQALAQQLEQKIQEQQNSREQKGDGDLLAQAASALSGHDSQQGASGQQQKQQQKGAGGIQSNARQEGQGEEKESERGSGAGQDQASVQHGAGAQQGGSQTNPKERGQDNSASGEKDAQKPQDQNNSDANPDKDKPGKTQGGAREGAGTQRASADPPPRGESPTERFYKAGEGPEALKGAGYVTVQLPEEVLAETQGVSRLTKDPKSPTRTQIPVSNIPLPAHVPNAPAEKQPVPIEYRGIIR